MSFISHVWHIKEANVKSNELQSSCSKKSLMARYPYLIAQLLILEAHIDMAMVIDIHVQRKDTRVREASQT